MTTDILMMPLDAALRILQQQGVSANVVKSRPQSRRFQLIEDKIYVIRQRVNDDGTYELVTAAKMGKEVLNNGL